MLAQKAVVGNAKPALQRGDGGYADWVIVSIHGFKTYLDLPYRRLLDVLYEMRPCLSAYIPEFQPLYLDYPMWK